MKNITFSADERLIEEARARARAESTTINDEFRKWLEQYARPDDRVRRFEETLKDLQKKFDLRGRKFTRDEMNER